MHFRHGDDVLVFNGGNSFLIVLLVKVLLAVSSRRASAVQIL